MFPEVGNFALMLAAVLALTQAYFGLAGAAFRKSSWCDTVRTVALGQGAFVTIAFAALVHAFLTNDFSVRYVVQNSNSALPVQYRVCAAWGAHEGSMLLWATMLAWWTAAVSLLGRHLPQELQARVLGVMGVVSAGFLAFVLLTSNPFLRIWPAADEGRDLNPLLQDPGLIFHPPLLYAGYVGFSVAFAFALAALLEGRLDAAWLRWTRPWTLAAWGFLTAGICLGSFWAYYELGWGGWWFWDPVENASFMPWLIGTALLHSMAASEQRGVFKGWTVILALSAFALSLLGTFLVRSGVLTSVHAFATDPTRGLFILLLLSIVVGGSLALFVIRMPRIKQTGARFSLISRESALFLNNIMLCVATASILLGTLYPLATEALGLGKLSVGAPYFNTVFVPIALALGVLLGVGPILRWKEDSTPRVLRMLRWTSLGAAVVAAVAWTMSGAAHATIALCFGMGAWILLSTLRALRASLRSGGSLWNRLRSVRAGQWGMVLAHIGFGCSLIGAGVSSSLSVEAHRPVRVGDEVPLAGYVFRIDALEPMQGANYQGLRGRITVRTATTGTAGAALATLQPEKRMYPTRNMPMTEAGIDASLLRDFYVSLGEPLGDGRWSIRIYVKPLVRWIWMGALFMVLGAGLALLDRRYRVRAQEAHGGTSAMRAAQATA